MPDLRSLYSALPSVDSLLKALACLPEVKVSGVEGESPLLYDVGERSLSRTQVRDEINVFLDICRVFIKEGRVETPEALVTERLVPALFAHIVRASRPHFRRVLNATGVVIHTNLGRSLLAEEAVKAVHDACANYSNLEMNLATGQRGSRYSHVERLICSLTGAEAALVVNNNAAAVLLMLDTLCKGKEVIVSRGQLVEIGGSFRIPEVMEKSGCTLKEVGATNRTHLQDYENAITENTAALLRVHTSNYRIIGFQKDVPLVDMVHLGRERGLPVLEDLGSGYLCDLSGSALQHLAQDEPPVRRVVADGVDVVTFSGDKVLGGPQSGIIAGRAEYINRIKQNPLNRALRIDKMTLAALEATLRLYVQPEIALEKVPTLRMICAPEAELKKRAARLAKYLDKHLGEQLHATFGSAAVQAKATLPPFVVVPGNSLVGGGSFPERALPTALVTLNLPLVSASVLREALLHTDPPLIVRVLDEKVCLDVRTLRDDEFPLVCQALQQALEG